MRSNTGCMDEKGKRIFITGDAGCHRSWVYWRFCRSPLQLLYCRGSASESCLESNGRSITGRSMAMKNDCQILVTFPTNNQYTIIIDSTNNSVADAGEYQQVFTLDPPVWFGLPETSPGSAARERIFRRRDHGWEVTGQIKV